MRTTIILNDDLFRRAKARAASDGRTLTSLIEGALRDALEKSEEPRERIKLPVHYGGRFVADFDLSNNAAMWDFLDEEYDGAFH